MILPFQKFENFHQALSNQLYHLQKFSDSYYGTSQGQLLASLLNAIRFLCVNLQPASVIITTSLSTQIQVAPDYKLEAERWDAAVAQLEEKIAAKQKAKITTVTAPADSAVSVPVVKADKEDEKEMEVKVSSSAASVLKKEEKKEEKNYVLPATVRNLDDLVVHIQKYIQIFYRLGENNSASTTWLADCNDAEATEAFKNALDLVQQILPFLQDKCPLTQYRYSDFLREYTLVGEIKEGEEKKEAKAQSKSRGEPCIVLALDGHLFGLAALAKQIRSISNHAAIEQLQAIAADEAGVDDEDDEAIVVKVEKNLSDLYMQLQLAKDLTTAMQVTKAYDLARFINPLTRQLFSLEAIRAIILTAHDYFKLIGVLGEKANYIPTSTIYYAIDFARQHMLNGMQFGNQFIDSPFGNDSAADQNCYCSFLAALDFMKAKASEERVGLTASEEKVGLTASEEKVGLIASEEKVGLIASEEKVGLTAQETLLVRHLVFTKRITAGTLRKITGMFEPGFLFASNGVDIHQNPDQAIMVLNRILADYKSLCVSDARVAQFFIDHLFTRWDESINELIINSAQEFVNLVLQKLDFTQVNTLLWFCQLTIDDQIKKGAIEQLEGKGIISKLIASDNDLTLFGTRLSVSQTAIFKQICVIKIKSLLKKANILSDQNMQVVLDSQDPAALLSTMLKLQATSVLLTQSIFIAVTSKLFTLADIQSLSVEQVEQLDCLVTNPNVLLALRQHYITVQDLKEDDKERITRHLLTGNGFIALKEHLITAADTKQINGSTLMVLFAGNGYGLTALREGLISLQYIKELPNWFILESLLTADGLAALRAQKEAKKDFFTVQNLSMVSCEQLTFLLSPKNFKMLCDGVIHFADVSKLNVLKDVPKITVPKEQNEPCAEMKLPDMSSSRALNRLGLMFRSDVLPASYSSSRDINRLGLRFPPCSLQVSYFNKSTFDVTPGEDENSFNSEEKLLQGPLRSPL
jgi:hypothetical protein